MSSRRAEPPIIAFSVRAYQALLLAYPTTFRQEYGSHMAEVFRDCCLQAFRRGGPNGMARLWLLTLLDLMHSVIEQHLQKETFMSKIQAIKLSGWAFMLAAFGFIAILNESMAVSLIALAISSILLLVGMLGLRAGYADRVGSFGRTILLLGVLGMLLVFVSVGVLYRIQPQIQIGYARIEMRLLVYFGPAVALLGLALFGLAALRRKPMAGLNWLPVVTGVWYPAMYSFFFYFYVSHNGVWYAVEQIYWVAGLMMVIQFVTLCLFGFVLSVDTREEMATA
jgi:hypothetical protein